MLPVQTVMIRYMVLVYRWGRGWLGAVGDWGGFVGGSMMGGGAATDGCARHPGLPLPGAKRPRRREAGGASAHIIQNLPLVLNSHPYWCPSCSLYPVG